MGTGALISIVIGIIFLLLGVIFLVVMFTSRKKANEAKAWPTIAGTVTSSEIRVHQDYDTDSHTTSTNYEPVVQYSYNVVGTPCQASRIAFGANQFDRNTAQAKINRYPAGSTVTVHYDPNDPSKAVLETEAAGSKVFMIVGIVFAVIGLYMVCTRQ